MTHNQAAELLGAHAVDAVVGEELDDLRDHLRDCAACQAELAQHRETVAFLAPAGEPAPAQLWSHIAGSLEEAPPPLRLAAAPPPPAAPPAPAWKPREVGRVPSGGASSRASARRGWMRGGVAAAMVAAAVVAGVVIGINVTDSGGSAPSQTAAPAAQLNRAVAAALNDPAARRVSLQSTNGSLSADAVVLPDGTGYMVTNNLPRIDTGGTYQLWGVVGAKKISLGLLGPNPASSGFKVAGDVSALAITREAPGGAVVPTGEPVVVGVLPA